MDGQSFSIQTGSTMVLMSNNKLVAVYKGDKVFVTHPLFDGQVAASGNNKHKEQPLLYLYATVTKWRQIRLVHRPNETAMRVESVGDSERHLVWKKDDFATPTPARWIESAHQPDNQYQVTICTAGVDVGLAMLLVPICSLVKGTYQGVQTPFNSWALRRAHK